MSPIGSRNVISTNFQEAEVHAILFLENKSSTNLFPRRCASRKRACSASCSTTSDDLSVWTTELEIFVTRVFAFHWFFNEH